MKFLGRSRSRPSDPLRLLIAFGGVLTVLAACDRGESGESGVQGAGALPGVAGRGSASGAGGVAASNLGGGGMQGGKTGTSGAAGTRAGAGGALGAAGGAGTPALAGMGGRGLGGAGAGGLGTAGAYTAAVGGVKPHGCTPEPAGTTPAQIGQCQGSFVHRAADTACALPPHLGPAGTGEPPGTAGSPPTALEDCTVDADCRTAPNGYCVKETLGTVVVHCLYACTVDSDCYQPAVCACDNSYVSNVDGSSLTLGHCLTSSCRLDSDCAIGTDTTYLCISPVQASCGPPRPVGFRCQEATDMCSGPGDCPGTGECDYASGHFVCEALPVCGPD